MVGFPTNITLADGTPFNVTFDPGHHFDYAYPLLERASDQVDILARDRFTERSSTMWYHDHSLDFTAQNVYRGLAGFFLVRDNPILDPADPFGHTALPHMRDTSDEANADGAPFALRLPSGDFDIPLVLQEKTFGLNGELIYDVFNTDGFLGKQFLVNGMVQPYLPVKRRKYRLRFLNGSNARIYQLFLADKNGRSFPMTQIATEGGLLSRPVRRPSFLLGMAERVEVVIDFSQFAHPQFTELYIENRLLQDDGRGPRGTFERPELAARGTQILKFKLEEAVTDPSQVPALLRPFEAISALELSRAIIRTFVFERTNGQWAINGGLAGDLSRVIAEPKVNVGEIWRLINKSGGWWHPIHVHLDYMRVLKRNGELPFDGTGPDFGQSLERDSLARKETIVLGPNSEVEVFVKFHNYRGPFVFHCHNMEHEDHAMMGRSLTDNRHGLIASALVTTADGYAEREAAKRMVGDAVQVHGDPEIEITLGADKGYDAKEFIDALAQMKVTPHVAQNTSGRSSAVPDSIASTVGYSISQQKRKLIEQGFGWAKTVGNIRQVMVRAMEKVDQLFVRMRPVNTS